jgi:transcriptional regulator with XRE-family HTH domain
LTRVAAFALWLRDQRKKTGMTQTEVVDTLGVKYPVYRRLERVFGQRLITV